MRATVMWAGAAPGSVAKGHRRLDQFPTHALDCKWALTREAKIGTYPRVRAQTVPTHVPRCGHCGGGR